MKKEHQKMKASELKAKYAIELPSVDYSDEGLASSEGIQRTGKKPKASALDVVVWFNDLTISESGGIVTSTVSPNAQWAGIQKFVDPKSVDGASSLWGSQRSYFSPPGPGTTTSAVTQGPGFYRGFSSDFDYNVHISAFLSIS